ncbi:tyrosine-type recombinase/integrase [Bacillus safensis]|uniref:tyrosine-type recombinase/integrase n=1 Tax=Bacillus safensis TaxID=561879 RepID=UPI00187C2D28
MINCFFYFFTWFIKRGLIYDWPIEETCVTKIRFHDLRHTCATILLLNGAPVKAVSERPGHKSNTSNICSCTTFNKPTDC